MLSGIFCAFLHFVPPKSVNLDGLFAINMEVRYPDGTKEK